MGIVKNGAVSGVLPSTGAFAVHYPGYPSSTSRALETLGGTEVIAKARCLQSNKLELRFRPEDPYSHPAFGEIQPCNSLLLKISKRNSNKGQIVEASKNTSKSPPTSDDVQIDLAVDIVARVLEGYHFNGMADYQHVLAIHADTARRKKRHWTDMKPHFEKGSLMDVDQEDLMILLPPLFSPKDIPEKVVLRPSTASKSKKTPGVAEERWELDAEPSYFIDFNTEKIPEIVDWEKYVPQGSDQWEWQMFMSKLFEEKPIWHKESIGERFLDNGFVVGNNMLKRLLFRAAYYFSNGPFLRFWVRKGYDPRKDPGSRIYQRTDFRVPPLLRSYCDANAGNELKQKWKDICAFRVFPFKCHTLLQFVELADEYIQQEIREPPQLVTCSRASGWFSDHMLENLRLRVAVRFLSVYPKPGAEFVLKSASKNFEKSKRMRIWRLESKVDDYGQQQVIKETSHHDGDKEPNALEEEEEDDSEAENDEEFDAYDALPGGGEDGDFSLEQCSYLNEGNVSRNYLQDLFGSFPYTAEAGGDQLGHATACDEEYQIYEHYSDDNYSEDDQY